MVFRAQPVGLWTKNHLFGSRDWRAANGRPYMR